MFYYNELGQKIKHCLWSPQGILKVKLLIQVGDKTSREEHQGR